MISFFKDGQFVIGADYSEREDCVLVAEIDFNPTTQDLVLEKKKGKYQYQIIDRIINSDILVSEESNEQKKLRLRSEMKALILDIRLMEYLEEDTTDIKETIGNLRAEYLSIDN